MLLLQLLIYGFCNILNLYHNVLICNTKPDSVRQCQAILCMNKCNPQTTLWGQIGPGESFLSVSQRPSVSQFFDFMTLSANQYLFFVVVFFFYFRQCSQIPCKSDICIIKFVLGASGLICFKKSVFSKRYAFQLHNKYKNWFS